MPGTDAAGWQVKTWTPDELAAAEARGCSFGVRLNLIPAAVLDCDAEGATADAAPIVADVAARLLGRGARRSREGTARFALVYRTAAIGDGKRVACFKRGDDSFGVELFSGSGQVLFGPRHSSGAPYLWDSPPDYAGLPLVAVDGEALFGELAKALAPLGYTLAGTAHFDGTDALDRDASKRGADPLWQALVARRLVLFEQRDGRAAVRCPFDAEHTSTKGKRARRDSSTAYLPPPAEGGNGTGYLACLHISCAERSQADFGKALGVELPPDPIIEFPQSAPIPGIPGSLDGAGFVESAPPSARHKPRPMAAAAFRGPFGRAAELFAGSCEASRENLLLHSLVAFSAVPDRAAVEIGRARPAGCSLQALIVGPTARGRKGTALSYADRLLAAAFPTFVRGDPGAAGELAVPAATRVLYGLSSGEGLVYALRDARAMGKDLDAGSPDKRLLVLLEEFSALLKVAAREGNTLSEIFRQIHDNGALGVPTRREPLYASRSHVAAIAHCTPEELSRKLDAIELVNGMLNRWLIAYVERARVDAAPPAVDPARLDALATDLRARLAPYAFDPGREWRQHPFALTPAAENLWREELYIMLDGGDAAGVANTLGVRFTAHAKRLALLYALADGATAIGVEHLRAAVAVLAYCEESMAYLFGTETHADPFTERVADVIREGQGAYVPRGVLWKSLGHSVSAARIDGAIAKLHETGAVRVLRGPAAPNGVRPWVYSWRLRK
ncbi:MAG: DUF3987 domain-containing protein [Betaproteobacteria bacterium]|nr:DUF3987 domain-containing protein [Betaproteobacteria bacterium]